MADDDDDMREKLKAALWFSVGKIVDEECLAQGSNATPQFIGALTELVWTQIENTAQDLENFARHAGRSRVTTDDVLLITRRNTALQDLMKDFIDSHPKEKAGKSRVIGTLNTLATCSGQLDPHEWLPSIYSRLPWEIQHQIWEYVGISAAFSTFALVVGEASRLIAEIDSKHANTVCLERGNYIAIGPLLSIFGTKYIRSVLNCREGEGIRIGENVGEIRTVATVGGICAIKLIGNSWDSGWLGIIPRPKDIWYGRILWERPDISGLHAVWIRCDYSALACTDISVEIPRPRKVTRDAWDQPDFPLIQHVNRRIFKFDQDPNKAPRVSRQSIEVEPWRFFRYLQFYKGVNYITGLTIYHFSSKILGIEAHYPVGSRLIGSSRGLSRYCPFGATERITHIWIEQLVRHQCWTGTLTLQTSKKRIVDLGPYTASIEAPIKRRWILLRSQGVISGLFIRNSVTSGVVSNLGITSEESTTTEELMAKESRLTPRYHNSSNIFLNPEDDVPLDSYFTMASLSNFCKVEMCRDCHDNSRCIGMLTHYKDGSRNVLGEWRANDVSSYSCIYPSKPSEVDRIQFKVKLLDYLWSGIYMVTDIEFLEVGQKTNHDLSYLTFSLGESLAWWFSCNAPAALVRVWAEEMVDAPEDCIHLQQFLEETAV